MKKICFGIVLLFMVSCKNYYNEMLDWMCEIPIGTSIDEVKKQQPSFIEIDWDKPNINLIDSSEVYIVQNIKWNYDILHMKNGLIFKQGKFTGRFVHK